MAKTDSDRLPHVGIFWLVGGHLLIDKVPISGAEPYGNHLTHPRSHIEVWEEYQRKSKVPIEMEYEVEPRGRVAFNRTTGRFAILVDRCILLRKGFIKKIKSELNLPKNSKVGTDSHYRCSKCLEHKPTDSIDEG